MSNYTTDKQLLNYDNVPQEAVNNNNILDNNDNLTTELLTILNQLKSQNNTYENMQLDPKENFKSELVENENEFSVNKNKTLIVEYNKEPKKSNEEIKSKIIDDLFASSRLSKRSFNRNNNSNVNEIIDDKSSMTSSKKRRIVDDLFITDRSVNTVINRKETDSLIGRRYIDPKLIIEEEKNVNNYQEKENIIVVVDANQKELQKNKEEIDIEEDYIYNKVIENKINSFRRNINIQDEINKTQQCNNTKDYYNNNSGISNSQDNNNKSNIFKGVDSFEFSDRNNISSIRSNIKRQAIEEDKVDSIYNNNNKEREEINKAENESNLHLEDIEIELNPVGIVYSIKPDIQGLNTSLSSIVPEENPRQSTNREHFSKRESPVTNEPKLNIDNEQLSNSNRNNDNISINSKEKEINSQRVMQVSLSSFNPYHSKVNPNSNSNRQGISQKKEESVIVDIESKNNLNQSNLSENNSSNDILDNKHINNDSNNNNIDNDNHYSNRNSNTNRSDSLKQFHQEEAKIINSINVAQNTEPSFESLNPTIIKDSNLLNNQLIQMRTAFLSKSYFASYISFKNKDKYEYSNQLLYNYSSIIKSNYENIEDQYNYLYSSILMDEKKEFANTLLNQFHNNKYSQPKESIKRLEIVHLYSKEAFIKEYNYIFGIDSNDFEYYRIVNTDGNSFYHCFMFGYIEKLLLLQKTKELLSLFLDILRLSDFNDGIYQDINLKQSMTLFSIMSDYIQCNLITEAYLLFIASYANEEISNNIKNLFLIYLKSILFTMIYEETRVIKKKKNEDNDSNDNEKVINNKIVLSNILKNQMEASHAVLEMVPLLFGVKLKIYYLEGEIDSSNIEIREYKYNKNDEENNSNDHDDEKDITISLGYFYSGYTCVYSKSLLNSNYIFKRVNEPNIVKEAYSSNIYTIDDNIQCLQCQNYEKIVYFKKYNISVCNYCLIKCINNILIQRAKSFAFESYMNLECKHSYNNHIYIYTPIDYCRQICLNNDPIIKITNSNILVLYKESIPLLLSKIVQSLCFKCLNPFTKENQSNTLSCSCQLCHKCLLDLIKKASNNNIIINAYEKEIISKIQCVCKSQFNYSDSIKLLSSSFDEENTKAINRMSDIVSTKCMKCLETLIKPSDRILVQSTATKRLYQKMKIQKVNNDKLIKGLDYSDNEHLICIKCYKRVDCELNESVKFSLTQDQSLNNTIDKISKQGRNGKGIQCNICNLEHIVDRKDWEGMRKNSCCENNCFIY